MRSVLHETLKFFCLLILVAVLGIQQVGAQKQFEDFSEGSNDRLAISNALVIPDHEGLPMVSHMVVIEEDSIKQRLLSDAITAEQRDVSNHSTGEIIIDIYDKSTSGGLRDFNKRAPPRYVNRDGIYGFNTVNTNVGSPDYELV